MTRRRLLLVVLWCMLASPVRAQVYQYAVPAKDVAGKEITAFLWVPPDAERIRGVLIGGSTLMEPEFAGDPVIRKACAAEQLAIVYFFPSLDAVFDYKEKNAATLLQKALDALAEASGYREIAVAPLFPFGHSVGTIFASHVVCWNPERCFGALLFKGGIRTPVNDPGASLVGVPILAIKGQFEEFGPGPSGVLRNFEDREAAWKGMRDQLLELRGKDERHLLSYLVDPGASHFAWSERLAPYTAQFIRKAAQARIPDWPADTREPVKCRTIKPASGALTGADPGRKGRAASYSEFDKKARQEVFWHLDLKLAQANDAFHDGMFDKKPQFVTFADPKSGKPLYVGHDLRLKLGVYWVGPDTFKVAGTFLDKVPDKYPTVEGAIGHAEGPVRFRAFGGSTLEPVGPDTFRVRLDGRRRPNANILAYHPGDATFRHAEQQGRLGLPERLAVGKSQTISFPTPQNLRAGSPPLKLQATSDATLPVRYYVESGPAVIEGDVLKLTEIPQRATFPLTITVFAYQYGSAVEPFVQRAELVKQVVSLEK